MSNQRKTKYHVKKRYFLNRDPEMTAFAVGIVEDTSEIPDEEESGWKWGKIELMLADCNRKVCFCFDMNDAEERSNSLYKIRRLAEVINAVKAALETEAKSISRRRPPNKKTDTNG
jgi:hypothetical protein